MKAISLLHLLLAAALAAGSAGALAEKGGKHKDFGQGPAGQSAGKGKQGKGKTYLASPAVVAASCALGHIAGPEDL